ncbi:GDP-fucose protein O-fucosyltransferase 1 [Holothuria leucospilota]|uniref:GDP-fucose protein O-fucosyltransferase 1 n=1 Tax=Holothuria leucospilota TaxID=206669 RepID=A0A9Q1H373_HOLLE|nr:GDP-fucose protein O-fucosyltransferase 1 [Holothuria leucospilota]
MSLVVPIRQEEGVVRWIFTMVICLSLLLMSCGDTIDSGASDENGTTVEEKPEWDTSGYIMFCPCMGRFGNQAEHYIGAMAFAKAIDRTLVLPPFRTYKNVPISDWFQVKPLQDFHKSITMEDFMKYFGEDKWPPGKRKGYCWLPSNSEAKCEMKNGNPFGPFWNGFNIDFDDYVRFDMSNQADITNKERMGWMKQQWDEKFPASEHPVIAFRGAPASFPMVPGNRQIHKYFKWNPSLFAEAEDEIARLFHGEKFVGIHLRTGKDWVSSCTHAVGSRSFMASTQCLPHGELVYQEMCYPTAEAIVELTTEAVKKYEAQHLYIATDQLSYSNELSQALKPLGVKVHHLDPHLPQMDLMILGQADFFIGNCVSSFTSFVKRERDANGKPSGFWGFPL